MSSKDSAGVSQKWKSKIRDFTTTRWLLKGNRSLHKSWRSSTTAVFRNYWEWLFMSWSSSTTSRTGSGANPAVSLLHSLLERYLLPSLWIQEAQRQLVEDLNVAVWKKQLEFFCDPSGIWRWGARMSNTDLSYSAKHPVLLPQHHLLLTVLFVKDAH